MKQLFLVWSLFICAAMHAQDQGQQTINQDPISLEEVSYSMLTPIDEDVKADPVKKTSKSRMVAKADSYFDKMWYAEASALYEKALRDQENHSFDVLRKAADAYYFNTNMERAYYWYDKLYKNYKDEMPPELIFKYAHSLKGNGKYGRAKRLMRLYNKKINDPEYVAPDQNEKILKENEQKLDLIMAKVAKNIELKNAAINTEYSDFGVQYFGDDGIMYASAKDSSFFKSRTYKWNEQPYLDIYTAKLNKEDQEVRDAVKLSKNINTKYHEASVSFTPDNETMFFTRNNYEKKLLRDKNGINHLKIFVSKKVDGEWQEATSLPFNSDDYSCGHPTVSPDGKQLYFISDMPGSIGNTDIFVVDILEDGSYSNPKNLGPEINTENREMFPFFDGKKLFFASDGHVGLGGLDVFEVALDEEEGFGEVKNMGQPINSNKDDFAYIVNKDYDKGFLSSNRSGGRGDDDIYSFVKLMPDELDPVAISGVVLTAETGDVIPNALIELLDENNKKIKEIESDADGSFVFEDLKADTKYTLRTQADTFETLETDMAMKTDDAEVTVALDKVKAMIAVEDGIKKIKLNNIHFNFDQHNIRPDAATELDKAIALMQQNPSMKIRIESHTDSWGDNDYNLYLSDKRAKSTKAYMVAQGIDPERIVEAKGFGEEQLLNECFDGSNCSKEMHRLNRRSEFIIVDM